MKKLSILILAVVSVFQFVNPHIAKAGAPEGLAFLKSKQLANGSIDPAGTFSNPSNWSAIAFSAHGIDVATVKNPGISLMDYLQADISASTASEIAAKILAIYAVGGNPANFGGVNYVQSLENQYNATQLGDPTSVSEDMFGLLALIASGNSANPAIRLEVLNFLINHQSTTGGFSWSSDPDNPDPNCFCSPSADMTSAALAAMFEAKQAGLGLAGLDSAIANAQGYLLGNQNGDGGFGYFGTSDADSTAWVLVALNRTLPGSSVQAAAKDWLENSQLQDGGFPSFGGSNPVTTAYGLVALSGQGWLVQPPAKPTPLPSPQPLIPEPQPAIPASTPSPTASTSSATNLTDTQIIQPASPIPANETTINPPVAESPPKQVEASQRQQTPALAIGIPVGIAGLWYLIHKIMQLTGRSA